MAPPSAGGCEASSHHRRTHSSSGADDAGRSPTRSMHTVWLHVVWLHVVWWRRRLSERHSELYLWGVGASGTCLAAILDGARHRHACNLERLAPQRMYVVCDAAVAHGAEERRDEDTETRMETWMSEGSESRKRCGGCMRVHMRSPLDAGLLGHDQNAIGELVTSADSSRVPMRGPWPTGVEDISAAWSRKEGELRERRVV